MKQICDVAKAMIHRCLIGDKPDAGAPQKGHLLQPLYSKHDASAAVWTNRLDLRRSRRLNPLSHISHGIETQTEFKEYLRRDRMLCSHQPKQQMLGSDVTVLQAITFVVCVVKHAFRFRR